MPRASFVLVRIGQKGGWALLLVALSALVMASPEPSGPPGGSGDSDPRAHHHPSTAQAASEAPPPSSAPARSTTINTPSWFEGGEALYVPPYFDTFKGIDLSTLTASQKERFLHRVNTEF